MIECGNLRDENALVFAFVYEVAECLVCHGEDMRFRLLPTPPPVHVNVLSRVYGKRAVGIYCDQEESGVSLDASVTVCPCPTRLPYIYQIRLVSHVEVVDDRGLVEMGEFCHVVRLVELGRIDLVYGVRLDLLLGAIVALYEDASFWQVFDDPASDECRRRISKPDIALAREVVLALDDAAYPRCLLVVF
jgi:hypothetical protein